MPNVEKWSYTDTTNEIRSIALSDHLTISYKKHAIERMQERELIVSDVLHVLKFGFCYREALPSTRVGYHKYEMENKTPNSGNREVRVIVIPDKKTCFLKIVSIMWVDEKETVSGSIVGEKNG